MAKMKTLEIDINPRGIDYNRLNRPLFRDQFKQRIGDEILKAAREKGEWVPVDLIALLGTEYQNDYWSALDSMRRKGYVTYSTEKGDFTAEPTQKLARYYRLVDFLNKKRIENIAEK